MQAEISRQPKEEGNGSHNPLDGNGNGNGNGGGGGGPPPPPPPASPASFPSSPSSPTSSKQGHKGHDKSPLIKLDVKFELPIYDGELNAENLDNWVRKIEVYWRIQNIDDDITKSNFLLLRWEEHLLFGGKQKRKISRKVVRLFILGMIL